MGYTPTKGVQRDITDITPISADYAMTGEETFIGINTTAGEVVITLPAVVDMPVGTIREYQFGHASGSNNVKIQCAGTDEFIYGNTYFNLGTQMFRFTVAILHGGVSKWGLVRNATVRAEAHREANWSSGNFSSMTILPWDAEPYNNQDEILEYTPGAPSRYTVQTAGTYKLNYTIDIDSTGGGTWNATSQVFKNGVALANTQVRTGNYGSEDQSMALPCTNVALVAGDYLDLRIDQNSLTGNIVHSVFRLEVRL